MYNKGKQFENQFFIYEPKCKTICIFWAIWGALGGGGVQCSDWAYLLFQLSSHPYICTCQIRKQSDKKCLSLNPKYECFTFFIFGGSWGALTLNPGERKFQGSKISSQSRQIYNKGKNNHLFFIYGPQCEKKIAFWAIRGGGGGAGWPIYNRTRPILPPSYPLTYSNLHFKYGSNPIRIFKVIVRTMKCLRTQRRRRNDD